MCESNAWGKLDREIKKGLTIGPRIIMVPT